MSVWRLHVLVGLSTLVVLPLASRVFGDGFFAWTMYARSSEYRIEVQVHDASGWRSISPTGLADHTSRPVAGVLVGAETYRRSPSLAVLRDHLGELAALVCRERSGDRTVVILYQRDDPKSVESVTRVEAECSPR